MCIDPNVGPSSNKIHDCSHCRPSDINLLRFGSSSVFAPAPPRLVYEINSHLARFCVGYFPAWRNESGHGSGPGSSGGIIYHWLRWADVFERIEPKGDSYWKKGTRVDLFVSATFNGLPVDGKCPYGLKGRAWNKTTVLSSGRQSPGLEAQAHPRFLLSSPVLAQNFKPYTRCTILYLWGIGGLSGPWKYQ